MRKFYLLIVTTLAIQILSQVDVIAQNKAEKIDRYLNQIFENGQLSGTVLAAEDGQVIYEKGFGYADMEWKILNTTDTKFRIASLTKQFTAMLVLQMVEEGTIELDGKINDYISWYPENKGKEITIHHLLSHTSGIPHYEGIPDFFPRYSRQQYTHEKFVKLFANLELLFEPGEKFSYSSFGYYLLGYILEQVSGKSFSELLTKKILEPVGMMNTSLDDHSTIVENRASGYDNNFGRYTNAEFRDMSTALATGDMLSTVHDLFLWDQALYTNELISDEYKKLFFKSNLSHYGYGWYNNWSLTGENDSVIIATHNGGTVGFQSLIVRYLNDNKLTIVLTNVVPSYIYQISSGLKDILFGTEPELPKISIAETLAKIIREKSINEAVKQYKKLEKDFPDEYNFSINELDGLGRYLMKQSKISDAIEIFKLNVQSYPDDPVPYNSLGDAYLIFGNRRLAIENYEKSFRLNPDDENQKEKLKRAELKR